MSTYLNKLDDFAYEKNNIFYWVKNRHRKELNQESNRQIYRPYAKTDSMHNTKWSR